MQTITAALLAALTRGERLGFAMPRASELAARPLEFPPLTEADHAGTFDRGSDTAPSELPRARGCGEADHPRARDLAESSPGGQTAMPLAVGVRVKHIFRRAEAAW